MQGWNAVSPTSRSRQSPPHVSIPLVSCSLLCKWAPWPSALVPATYDYTLLEALRKHPGGQLTKANAGTPILSGHYQAPDFQRH